MVVRANREERVDEFNHYGRPKPKHVYGVQRAQAIVRVCFELVRREECITLGLFKLSQGSWTWTQQDALHEFLCMTKNRKYNRFMFCDTICGDIAVAAKQVRKEANQLADIAITEVVMIATGALPMCGACSAAVVGDCTQTQTQCLFQAVYPTW